MASQYFAGFFSQLTSKSCTVDTSLPTFAGISAVTPNADGSFSVSWAAATSTKTPVRYEIFAGVGTLSAAALFVTANRVFIAPSALLLAKVFVLRDQTTYFVNGQDYTFGVRAVDAQNYVDTNTVVITSTAIASGNITGLLQTVSAQLQATETAFAATEVLLAADHVNFQADHANFQTDHTNFGTDHANFVADDAAFDADHTNFQADHAALVTDLATFSGYLTTFNGYLATFNTLNTSLAGNVSTFSGDLVTLAANLATLATDLSTFASQNTALTTQVNTLTGLVSALQAAIAGVTSSGGLNMAVTGAQTLNFEIVDENGVLI